MRVGLAIILGAALALAAPVSVQAGYNQPYTPELDPSGNKIAEEQGKQALEQHERTVAEAREKEEHEARIQQEHERVEHENQQTASGAPEATIEPLRCVVPSLKGHSLGGARRLLRAARCKLGRVTASHGAHGQLVVTAQSPRHGRKLNQGAAVSVTIGR